MPEAVTLFLSQAIEGYLIDFTISRSPETKRIYSLYLKQFLAWMGDVRLKEITPSKLAAYLIYLKTDYTVTRGKGSTRGDRLSSSALDNHWKVIRSLFRWCNDTLNLDRPDLKLPRPEVVIPEIIPYSQEDINQLLSACDWTSLIRRNNAKPYKIKKVNALRNRIIILLLLDTGIRVGELCRLNHEDIDLQGGMITIQPHFSSRKARPRHIPIGEIVKKQLWLYLNNHNDAGQLLNIDPQHVRLFMWRLAKQTGKDKVHPHRFRHTFAIQFLRNGGNVYTLQYILGHSSLEMVKHYIRLADMDIKSVHQKASPVDRWKF